MKRFRDLLERIPLPDLEPLEVREAILDEIEETMIEPVADGRRRLSNRITVTLTSADAVRRTQLRRALTTQGGLKKLIVERCAGQGVEVPNSLVVDIEDRAAPDPQNPAEYQTRGWTEEVIAPQPAPINAQVTVLTTGQTIQVSENVFRIGREKEPKDRSGRPKPENHLFFGETENSVSRQHAQICFDQATREYRIWDLSSTQGTKILRDDREIEIPKSLRAPGIRLRSGDLIYFGKVGVRFNAEPQKSRTRKATSSRT
jgi:pSer/pThr/pTyr-binding forkhead associated (FHA) protein